MVLTCTFSELHPCAILKEYKCGLEEEAIANGGDGWTARKLKDVFLQRASVLVAQGNTACLNKMQQAWRVPVLKEPAQRGVSDDEGELGAAYLQLPGRRAASLGLFAAGGHL